MNFRPSPELEAFRREVQAFIAENLTPEVQAGGQLAANTPAREFVKKMGRRGWLSFSWPEAYGGQEKSPLYLSVLNEELAYAGAPGVPVATAIVGPTLMACAGDWLKDEMLPRIARGDVLFCLGYTEPDS